MLIYAAISLILGACMAATYPAATATPIAQHLVATPSPLLPPPTSTTTPTPSPTLTPTATPLPTWQLLIELGSSFARVAAAPTGQVWAVGADGLFRFDGQTRQTFPLPNSLHEQILTSQMGSGYVVTDLLITSDDVVWVGTFQDSLYRFEKGTWTHYTTVEGLVDHSIVGLVVDTRNNLWVGTPHTLSRFDGQAWQVVPIAGQAQISTRLTSLAITPAGQVWVAVEQKGVYQFDGQNWTHHSKETRPEWADTLAAVAMYLVAGPDEQV
ncbi:MAG: hypothetical protein U0401_05750 [Anaerolineae bacterium]